MPFIILKFLQSEEDDKTKGSKQRVEQYLSVLVFGCKNGHIYAYSAGQVLLYHIKPPTTIPRLKILSGDIGNDLQNFDYLGQRVKKSELSERTEFTFKHFRNIIIPSLIDTIGNLNYRFSLLKSTWKQVLGQLNTLTDYWSKIYEVYTFYIHHCQSMTTSESLAQYYELALNRVESV